MPKTNNYNLNQWAASDPIRRTDFNADNAAIDAALAGNAKALSDYKTANDAAVAKKADKTALAALEQSVQTLSSALGSGGRTARIAWGSYTGNGTYGSTNAVTLTFDFCPVVVMVGSERHISDAEDPAVLLKGWSKGPVDRSTSGEVGTQTYMTLTWSGNSVSYYNPAKALYQCNSNGYVYNYVAIGYDASTEG